VTVVFTDASSGLPTIVGRRYEGGSPLDTAPFVWSSGWSSGGSVSRTGTYSWAAWQERTSDVRGDIAYARVADGVMPVGTADTRGEAGVVDQRPAIVAHASDRATLGWQTDSIPEGLRIEAIGWSFPPEAADLIAHLAGGRERDLQMLPTPLGLWLTWTDASIPGATSSVVAYLLPWD
jgi:hypothetical protein